MSMNTFDKFSVLLWDGNVRVGESTHPLGQITTDILNLNNHELIEIENRTNAFLNEFRELKEQNKDSAVFTVQEKLNAVWDAIFALPLYCDLPIDHRASRNLFPMLLSDDDKWNESFTIGSDGNKMLFEFLALLEYFAASIRNFRGQIAGMLDLYFERLKRRSTASYAGAYSQYYQDMTTAGAFFFTDRHIEQSFSVQVKFRPMCHPEKTGETILAEETEFSALSHFLYTDFYRGLIAGNAPRRCHNCGRYFLLSSGYDTCYCNNIAPGETEKTCRKVGAHKKAHDISRATPAMIEYRKVSNRLKTRKNRGKISTDEWNSAVARALDLKDRAERGEICDVELRKIYDQF